MTTDEHSCVRSQSRLEALGITPRLLFALFLYRIDATLILPTRLRQNTVTAGSMAGGGSFNASAIEISKSGIGTNACRMIAATSSGSVTSTCPSPAYASHIE